MTEIPANTPRPMGRTDSFFPGSTNAAAAVLEADAAAAEAAVADGLVPAAALLPEEAGTDDTPFAVAPEPPVAGADAAPLVAAAAAPVETALAGIVEAPCNVISVCIRGSKKSRPLTFTVTAALPDTEAALALAVDAAPPEEAAAADDAPPEEAVAADDALDEADVPELDDPELDDPVLDDPELDELDDPELELLEPDEPVEITQTLTSWNWPSLRGVRTIVHVWVVPSGLWRISAGNETKISWLRTGC